MQSIKALSVVSVESSTYWQDEFVVLFRLVKGEKPANELNEEASPLVVKSGQSCSNFSER